ncbi:MAG: iron ABC transporter permease [Acidimicrobiia bacterium]|nr:iron ABC transporter permease [Acidimicrobiia bacterium]
MTTAQPVRLRASWLGAGVIAIAVAFVLGVGLGPVSLRLDRVALELLDHVPGIDVESGLTPTEAAIVWDIRLPRVVLGLLVGGLLAISGAAYQGVFRNPLADPYLLGIAAGAGLGATIAFVSGAGDASGVFDAVPIAAFAGAFAAVVMTFAVGGSGRRGASTVSLLLAGVAVASFFTALQTYVQSRNTDTIRQVFSWILGRLSTSGWDEVLLLLPYAAVSTAVLLWSRRTLDVLAVGDDEAATLGVNAKRVRLLVLVAASLAAAAAVSVSGLIGFVGLVVPHAVRLAFGTSNRVVVPLSFLFGAAFLALADLGARTVEQPAELPIGVVTAFFGAPFFLFILRTRAVTFR